MIRAIWSSVADTAIAPVQDLLGLGNESRMNVPASSAGNWSWRLTENLDSETQERLGTLTELFGRGR